jgi:hypothetical protein
LSPQPILEEFSKEQFWKNSFVPFLFFWKKFEICIKHDRPLIISKKKAATRLVQKPHLAIQEEN